VARQLVFENVVVHLENLVTYPCVQHALDAACLEIHGWLYDQSIGEALERAPNV
jgi:carbonic anhydrase